MGGEESGGVENGVSSQTRLLCAKCSLWNVGSVGLAIAGLGPSDTKTCSGRVWSGEGAVRGCGQGRVELGGVVRGGCS